MKIEEQGYCMYDNERKYVNIKCVIVADMSFLHKYLNRGGGSATTTCFCFMCSSKSYYRHKGYPGGCQKCRRNNSVYNTETGVQSCLHHDVCTPEFLKWEESRFDDLTKRFSKTFRWRSYLHGNLYRLCVTSVASVASHHKKKYYWKKRQQRHSCKGGY